MVPDPSPVQGVYYGAFPGEPEGSDPTVWAVSRPHNWHPIATEERLLSINTNSGELINSVQIPSRYVHHSWSENIHHGYTCVHTYQTYAGAGSLMMLSGLATMCGCATLAMGSYCS